MMMVMFLWMMGVMPLSSLLSGKFRSLIGACHNRFLSDGQLIHTPRAQDGSGNLVGGVPVVLPARFLTAQRTFRDSDGVEHQQDTVRVLREPLLAEAIAAGLDGFVANTEDLDAVFVDSEGNRFDTGRSKIDAGDAYVTIDVRLISSG